MRVLEKVISSNLPPVRQDVVWIDTSDAKNPIAKIYINGKWESASSESEAVQNLQNEIDDIVERLAGEGGTIEDLSEVRTKVLAAVAGYDVDNIISLTKDEYDDLVDKNPKSIYIIKTDLTNGIKYVDIGINDDGYHILFAKKNLDAETESDIGKYFQYGAINGHDASEGEVFNYSTDRLFNTIADDYIKYNDSDELHSLKSVDDVVNKRFGFKWQIPSTDDIQFLIDNYDTFEFDGENLIIDFTINGQHVKLPFGGFPKDDDIVDPYNGYYITSDINVNDYTTCNAYCFESDTFYLSPDNRSYGYLIRPVIKVKNLSELYRYDICIGDKPLNIINGYGVDNIIVITESNFGAITMKDSKTLYIVIPDEE